MLDTVILNIPKSGYKVIKPDNFSPPARNLDYQKAFYSKFVNNPTAEDKRKGIYKPRLTINKRGADAPLKIEFSAPKLLFGNNLDELSEDNFEKLIVVLNSKLWDMGIHINKDDLKGAEVASFHPSKNIPITGGYSAIGVIKELAKVNLNEKLDLNKTQFRNSGHGLQYYAKSHSLVFYDKLQDLQKTETRAIDKDQKIQQLSLFDYANRKDKPEILRMEVRLSERKKMNTILSAVGCVQKPVFSQIFKTDLCMTIMLHYFNTYLAPSLFIFDLDSDPQNILKRVMQNNLGIKGAKAVYLTGLIILSKDKGIRDLKKVMLPHIGLRTWQRVNRDIKSLNQIATIERSHDFIKEIKNSLIKYKPFRTV